MLNYPPELQSFLSEGGPSHLLQPRSVIKISGQPPSLGNIPSGPEFFEQALVNKHGAASGLPILVLPEALCVLPTRSIVPYAFSLHAQPPLTSKGQ